MTATATESTKRHRPGASVAPTGRQLRIEHELRAERDFTDAILNRLPGVFLQIDEDGRCCRWNQNLEAVTGYSADELAGMSARDLIAPDDRQLVCDRFAEVFEQGEAHVEADLLLKDGRRVPYQLLSARHDRGDGRRLIVIATDLSWRREIEVELREERDYADTIINSLPGIFAHYSADGRLLRRNRSAQELTGYTAAEVAAKHPTEFFPEDQHATVDEAITRMHANGTVRFEADYLLKSGERASFLWDISRFEHRGETGFVGLGVDTRAQKLAEEELRRERDFSDAALNGLPGIFFQVDGEGRFVRWNRNLETVTGLDAVQLSSMFAIELAPPDRREALASELMDGLEQGEVRVETDLLAAGGTLVPYLITLTRFVRDEERGFIGVGLDISWRREMEAQLRYERDYAERALDSLPGVFYHYDAQGNFIRGNRNLETTAGYSLEERAGMSVLDYFDPDGQVVIRQAIKEIFERGSNTAEADYVFRDGRRVPYLWTGVRLDHEGRPAFVGLGLDISQRRAMEDELRDARDFSDAVVDGLPGVFYQFDESGRFLRWNQGFETVTGYTGDELAEMQALDFIAEDHRPQVAARIASVFETGEAAAEADLLHKDGRRIPHLFTAKRFDQGGRRGFIGVALDISHRKRIESALREQTTLLEAQVESSLDGILVVSPNGQRLLQNQRLNEMWGVPDEVAQGALDARRLRHVARRTTNPAEFMARVAWLAEHPNEVAHDEIELVDGSVQERFSAPVVDHEGRYYGRTWIHRDITQRRRDEERIRHLATHDELTGLPNRNLVRQRMEQAITRARRSGVLFAVLYLDLDRFKIVNDGRGHAFGDEVLKAVAVRLTQRVRETDTVARHGGDEFLVLLTGLRGADDAYAVAQSIVEDLDHPITVRGQIVPLSISVGVSVFPQDGATVEELISNADTAMFRAKELGRNNHQAYVPEMSEAIQRRVVLEAALRDALAAGQLRLAYQPKMDLASGRITGCEALLRWHHPQLGEVAPDRLVPIAEDSGLIVPIGDWVLRTACTQAKAWLDAGLGPTAVAVNVSARQFLGQDVVAWVMGVLEDTGLPPELLELELTESVIAQDVERVIATFGLLRAAGVRLSIDDFGTGYSGLSYLKQFCADTLKIDRSFVPSMLVDTEDATIVPAIISLGHALGLKVVAEGVETRRQLRFLGKHGCDEFQGYYVSAPVPPSDIEAMLRGTTSVL
ncbi:MAG: PAS domain S-box protein [Chloroflexi bacterium]|nr:PAS domain S-box protein [Chloroflexota bacterium]